MFDISAVSFDSNKITKVATIYKKKKKSSDWKYFNLKQALKKIPSVDSCCMWDLRTGALAISITEIVYTVSQLPFAMKLWPRIMIPIVGNEICIKIGKKIFNILFVNKRFTVSFDFISTHFTSSSVLVGALYIHCWHLPGNMSHLN